MTVPTLEQRLATFRASRAGEPSRGTGPGRLLRCGETAARRLRAADRHAAAERLAAAVGGEWLTTPLGSVVRREPPVVHLPLERARLACLPGQPAPEVPLVCLDTETTGLGTATGTVAFLVGLGWWEGDLFHQLQLLLPDHADEPALLAALEAVIPPDAWLVTYNGRGFDWPLLVTRYRLLRRPAPAHAGMLDLLPHVRRLFRHRLGDARLATVERELLGIHRLDDVPGWEIPRRYLAFLRGGGIGQLIPVVAHNAEDVCSLGRLLAHLDARYADPDLRRTAPPGDLVALARGYTRVRRHADALACLEEAETGWRPPALGSETWPFGAPTPSPTVLTRDRIRAERARTLRRLGRADESLNAWQALAAAGGPLAAVAWVECAKLHEHRRADHAAALRATEVAGRVLEQDRILGRPDHAAERALAGRRRRLRLRLWRAGRAGPGPRRAAG